MMQNPWTLRDPEAGPSEYETEEEALKAAAEAIETYLDEDNSWCPGVKDILIMHAGVITHRTTEVKQDPPDYELEAMEDDPEYRPDFDYYCTYEMVPVEAAHA